MHNISILVKPGLVAVTVLIFTLRKPAATATIFVIILHVGLTTSKGGDKVDE